MPPHTDKQHDLSIGNWALRRNRRRRSSRLGNGRICVCLKVAQLHNLWQSLDCAGTAGRDGTYI